MSTNGYHWFRIKRMETLAKELGASVDMADKGTDIVVQIQITPREPNISYETVEEVIAFLEGVGSQSDSLES